VLKVWIVGGEEEALRNALQGFEAHTKLDITLIHRREHLDVDPKLREAFEAALAKSPSTQVSAQVSAQVSGQAGSQETAHLTQQPSSLSFKHGQVVRLMGHAPDNSPLTSLQWVDAEGNMHEAEVDLVLVNLGLSPQLGPIAQWGAAMHKKQITVNTEDFSTAVPGLFAIGDIVTYPGKKKLILSGFHEAALASFGVAKWVLQKDRIPFEYTSASSLLQERLGVHKK
ncbi:MAG: FAD-dependent oxidoreductase, partial [Betaproteobacteria bacterium]